MRLNAIVDDGAVFYLNGVEVYRVNMPDGAVSYSTPAASPVATPAYTGPIAISATNLVAGTNVFAVEVHQAAGDTSDMLFGAELIALPMIPPPVTLAFNEILGATNASFFLELMNHGSNIYVLEDFVIYHDGRTNFDQYVFPPGVSLGPNQFLALTNTTLNFEFAAGDKLFLYRLERQNLRRCGHQETASGALAEWHGPMALSQRANAGRAQHASRSATRS